MPYISPEVVEQARQIDLLTYLQSCEPQGLFFCRSGRNTDGKGGGDAVGDGQAQAESGAEGLASAG